MNDVKECEIANEFRVFIGLSPLSIENFVAERRALAKLRRRRAAALARELDAINNAWIDSKTMPSETRNDRAREALRRHQFAAFDEERALYAAFDLQK